MTPKIWCMTSEQLIMDDGMPNAITHGYIAEHEFCFITKNTVRDKYL